MPHRTDFARLALRRMGALRLPPTPSNFLRFYEEAMAAVGKNYENDIEASSLDRVINLANKVQVTAENLANELSNHQENLSTPAIRCDVNFAEPSVAWVQHLVSSNAEILSVVIDSQQELQECRKHLEQIRREMNEDRRFIGQDSLTGTENRRTFADTVNREIELSRREQAPLSIVMLDIDYFKLINDAHGHAAGDAALLHLTSLGNYAFRGCDTLARYGGDEFVITLPGTSIKGASSVITRFQELLKRRPLVYQSINIHMTFSAGIASLLDFEDQHSLMKRADVALYAAKRAGRNCLKEAASIS